MKLVLYLYTSWHLHFIEYLLMGNHLLSSPTMLLFIVIEGTFVENGNTVVLSKMFHNIGIVQVVVLGDCIAHIYNNDYIHVVK